MRVIKFLWIIAAYVGVLYLIAQHWLVAVFLLITLVGLIRGEKYSTAVWLQIDKLGAAVIHFYDDRTISGITGQNAYSGKLGYGILENLINLLFNDIHHCYNQWQKEIKILKFMETL